LDTDNKWKRDVFYAVLRYVSKQKTKRGQRMHLRVWSTQSLTKVKRCNGGDFEENLKEKSGYNGSGKTVQKGPKGTQR